MPLNPSSLTFLVGIERQLTNKDAPTQRSCFSASKGHHRDRSDSSHRLSDWGPPLEWEKSSLIVLHHWVKINTFCCTAWASQRTNAWIDESWRDHNQTNRVWVFSLMVLQLKLTFTDKCKLPTWSKNMHHSKRSVYLTYWAWTKETPTAKPDRLSVIMLLWTVWWKLIGLYLCLLESTWQPPLGSCSMWQTGAWLQRLVKPMGLWHSFWLGLSHVRGWKESGTYLVGFYYELFPSTFCCMSGFTSSVSLVAYSERLFQSDVTVSVPCTILFENLDLVLHSSQVYTSSVCSHKLFGIYTNPFSCVNCVWIWEDMMHEYIMLRVL